MEIRSKMPRKSRANRARAANLQRVKRYPSQPTSIEEIEEENFHGPDSHGCRDAPRQDSDDIIGDDAEFLEIIGCLRGSAMVDDEVESSESDSESEVEGEDSDKEQEIHEISALEHFSDTLQKAHDLALAAERERERGKKRPKKYNKNSNQTKRRCRQKGRELAAKGFHSVKEWFTQLEKPPMSESPANDTDTESNPKDFQESEESSSEDEISSWPAKICRSRPCVVPLAVTSNETSDANASGPLAETMEMVGLWENDSQRISVSESEESLDPEEKECLRCQNAVAEMLEDLKAGKVPHDNSPETSLDRGLNQINYKNFPALRRALTKLKATSKDVKIDVTFHARITAMVGALNLYLDPEMSYTWRQASMVVAKLQGKGVRHAKTIRQWIHQFINHGNLPIHHNKGSRSTILEDEDIALEIQLKLAEHAKDKYIKALDVVEIVASQEIQERLRTSGIEKQQISERTARRWLRKFKWRYSQKKKGMYIDGHEREDVVAYHQKFVTRFFNQYAPRMYTWDHDGKETIPAAGSPLANTNNRPFRLIPVTHDESTFFANDERKTRWVHESQKALPERKGDGTSIMISDFQTSEWGRLMSKDGTE